ncbi:MAG: hypothetical protein A2038_04960 [Deltaproteobacteria bacterium GWA2_57_13]|nr:MAG: hypothetical protein A2038_04960 [Deltaproteobacteria bacterium GWA2_57_13]OGQ48599.1 MAG: hypothetical protein A3I10_07155 [Deltaproteobacteria bacterium RIFCSPLOWO2_02_FULL_57_26]OGQ82524.1 MAG: hypothetical protein A3G40_12655 [Deltaproteobacteria bacterium RIFCSPLOWO2_12_FULL_57_22]
MTLTQKYVAWGTGVILWVFGLSILLSYFEYGYMDWRTVTHMTLILVPLVLIAAIVFYLFKRAGDLKAKDERVAHVGQTVTVGTR